MIELKSISQTYILQTCITACLFLMSLLMLLVLYNVLSTPFTVESLSAGRGSVHMPLSPRCLSWLTQLEASSSFLRFLLERIFTLWDTYWLPSYGRRVYIYILSCLLSDYEPLEGRTVINTIFCYSLGQPAVCSNLANAWEFLSGRKQLFNKCLLNGCDY